MAFPQMLTYQILINDDEVCIPSLSSILLAVKDKYVFDLTFTDLHKDCQKVPASDFRNQFSIHLNLVDKNAPVYANILLLLTFLTTSIIKTLF